jgi:hypothetical protein
MAVLKNLDDDMHVETRVSQYRPLKNGKDCYMAKKLVARAWTCERMEKKAYGYRGKSRGLCAREETRS